MSNDEIEYEKERAANIARAALNLTPEGHAGRYADCLCCHGPFNPEGGNLGGGKWSHHWGGKHGGPVETCAICDAVESR